MLLHQLLDIIDHDPDVHIEVSGHRIRLTGSPLSRAVVRADVAHHRDLLMAHLRGVDTGHVLAFCDTCGAATVTAAKAPHGKERTNWPTCRETPRCTGHHRPRPADLARRRDAPAPPPQPQPSPAEHKGRLLGPRPPYPPSANYIPLALGAAP